MAERGYTIAQVNALLARPRFRDGMWWNTGTHWSADDGARLQVLCAAGIPLEKAADTIGRSPTSIAHRARDTGLSLPPAWGAIIAPKRKPKIIPRIAMSYPYIMTKRPGHELLLAINRWVPRYLDDRDDICQEIMLAVLEGRITIDSLVGHKQFGSKPAIREFIRATDRKNREGNGFALSLDAPIKDKHGQSTALTIGDMLVGENSFEYWNRWEAKH